MPGIDTLEPLDSGEGAAVPVPLNKRKPLHILWRGFPLHQLVEKTLGSGVPHQLSVGPAGDADVEVPLRILPQYQQHLPGHQGHKGDVVVFAGGMAALYIPVSVALRYPQRLLRRRFWGSAAPGDGRSRRRRCRPEEKVRFPQTGQTKNRICFIDPPVSWFSARSPGEQGGDIDVQRAGEGLQQTHIRASLSPFPFADGLGTQAQRLCQFPLGHLPLLPQTADQGADFWIVHVLTSFNSIADFAARDNRRFVDPCGGKNTPLCEIQRGVF